MHLFKIEEETKSLKKIEVANLASQGFNEPRDLESWVMKYDKDIFARNVIWIAKQDYLNSEQRSDLIGVDNNGDLIVCELKQGEVSEAAVIQALGYTSEYSKYDMQGLSEKFLSHVRSGHIEANVTTTEDAIKLINSSIKAETKVNESQIIILVGEDFSPTALSIVEYLNNSSEALLYIIECWRYQLFPVSHGHYQIAFEQILPPPNIRAQIAAKREEIRDRKYSRDPNKIDFMNLLMAQLRLKSKWHISRRPGASYLFNIAINDQAEEVFELNVYDSYPKLSLPSAFPLEKLEDVDLLEGDDHNCIDFRWFRVADYTEEDLEKLFTDIANIVEVQGFRQQAILDADDEAAEIRA